MKNQIPDKSNKLILEILKELEQLKKKIHSDFIKLDIAILEENIKKLLK